MRKRPLLLFFVLAYALSWACWIPAALSGQDATTALIRVLHYAGILGPCLAGIILIVFAGDHQARTDYWARLVEFKRIRLRWYAVIVGLYPALYLLALFLDSVVVGHTLTLDTARHLISHPLSILSYSFLVLLLGPLPEELGWRGYALDRLQKRYSALNASLLLGAAWVIWHLPLFFIPGTYHFKLGLGSFSFWVFGAVGMLVSILFTWIYNNNNRSILSAILFHFMINYSVILLRDSESIERIQMLLLTFFVTLIVILWTPRTLRDCRFRNNRAAD